MISTPKMLLKDNQFQVGCLVNRSYFHELYFTSILKDYALLFKISNDAKFSQADWSLILCLYDTPILRLKPSHDYRLEYQTSL